MQSKECAPKLRVLTAEDRKNLEKNGGGGFGDNACELEKNAKMLETKNAIIRYRLTRRISRGQLSLLCNILAFTGIVTGLSGLSLTYQRGQVFSREILTPLTVGEKSRQGTISHDKKSCPILILILSYTISKNTKGLSLVFVCQVQW